MVAMTRAEILDAAKKCVTGGRDDDYGQPEDNFDAIARLWKAYIETAHPEEVDCSIFPDAVDVAVMMALVKIARIAKTWNADSFVDLAGYAACAGEIATGGMTDRGFGE